MHPSEEDYHTNYGGSEPVAVAHYQGMNDSFNSNEEIAGSGNLDKVRDILFGPQMRDYEKRFNRLEERLVKECSNLREENRKRLDSLDVYVRQEIESLIGQLKAERVERDETVKELAEELKTVLKSLEKRMSQLDEHATQLERQIRQQSLDLSKSLDEEIRQKSQEILAMLEQEAQEIRKHKADRSTLATLLAEMARQLNNGLS